MLLQILRATLMGMVLCSSAAQAAVTSEILGLDIDGTDFDVTFYDSSLSFNNIWDADADGTFGNDSSILNREPVFWNESASASIALLAIMAELGAVNTIIDSNGDSPVVPYGSVGDGNSFAWFDSFTEPGVDVPTNSLQIINSRFLNPGYHLVSFEPSANPVPIPTSGLLILLPLVSGLIRNRTR